jgi:pyruvate kinase
MNLKKIEIELMQIYQQLIDKEEEVNKIADTVHSQYRLSAKNLYRYLILRSFDLRKVHDNLSEIGISSLRTSEGYVFSNISNALKLLKLLEGEKWEPNEVIEKIGYKRSKKLLRKHANNLFNEKNKRHFTEIMVTMPVESAESIDLIKDLAFEGMEIARINLSHGNTEIWKKIVANIHHIQKTYKLPIKIYMDLAGPKIRTSKILINGKRNRTRSFIRVKEGEHLILTKKNTTGKETIYGKNNELISSAELAITIPEIIDDLRINDRVFFDDGMIKAIVISKTPDSAELLITRANKSKLSSNKGINLPDTHLNIAPLTDYDISVLPFICEYADMVGYSYVRSPEDVALLYEELEKRDSRDIGVVLKIENKEAFENLPVILFEAMKRPNIGVMIARGDLAVEIGFERISEVQNQILWFCEAGHIPVIWATQVLENLAKTGMATRAEVSDAAMSAQAECVMLNKGPFIVEAVRTLKEIIKKMEAHGFKKKSTMRKLNVANASIEKIENYMLPFNAKT